jgi:hypothetical protein
MHVACDLRVGRREFNGPLSGEVEQLSVLTVTGPSDRAVTSEGDVVASDAQFEAPAKLFAISCSLLIVMDLWQGPQLSWLTLVTQSGLGRWSRTIDC